MRFDLVDRVVELQDQRIVTVKAVTQAEEYLGDHFPGFPILPGVMMLEAMAQAARRLLAERHGLDHALEIAEARNIRYAGMVRPGEALRVEVDLRGQEDDGAYAFAGKGLLDGRPVVQGRFRLAPARPDGENPANPV
ncbi:MAG: beta-hydroxyacyl-ACP dehydratase [Planctomycetota bacterium]